MNQGILFALLSLIAAGINDVVFKKYSLKDRSRGVYIFGIGIIWTALQFITFKLMGTSFIYSGIDVGFGLWAGIFLTLSNIFLIESFTHLEVGLGSTLYRLNTIGVVILSFLFLHEPLGIGKALGICLGIIAVILLNQKKQISYQASNGTLFFVIAILASLFRALYGVITKAGLMNAADPQIILLIISSCWIPGGISYALFREKRFKITGKKLLYSMLSGGLVFLIANFLMLAVEQDQASTVIPIANMSFIVALFLSRILKMEAITYKKGIAVILAVTSIVLLSKA
jgi:drug/metabolite transporter (DMT)-like permease